MLKYIINVLIGLDEFVNAIFLGDPSETISSRLGKTKRHYGGKIPWRHPLRKIIDWGLEKIDPGHSIDAIEEDEGSDAVAKEPYHHECCATNTTACTCAGTGECTGVECN
jgi:hypothetical protein